MKLNDNPDWHAAGQDLISGLCSIEDVDQQIELLEAVCIKLGDNLYPAFLQILQVIDTQGDDNARSVMAKTLVSCLQMGRLPSGKLSAWGSSTETGDTAFGQSRRLGPIEFVCAWYAQPSTESPMSQQQFTLILESLLSLVSADDTAKQLYCFKLKADAEDELGGSLSSRTRSALNDLADSWITVSDNTQHKQVIDAVLTALQNESLLHQISQRPFV